MRHLTTVLLTISLLFGLHRLAWAQVAAPSLFPSEFVTTNPAAMQWGGPSRAGIIVGEGRTTDDPQASNGTTRIGAAGFRGVWDSFAIAAEGARGETTSGDVDTVLEQTQGAVSLRVLDSLALGAVYQESSFSEEQPTGFDIAVDSTLTAYGASLRVAEFLFLGYGQGRESIDVEFTFPASSTPAFSDERDVRVYGAGIRAGSNFRIHVEAYKIEWDSIAIGAVPPLTFQSSEIDERVEEVGILEIGWGSLIIGARAGTERNISDDETTHSVAYAIGLAPMSGWALVYQYEVEETKDDATGDIQEKSELQAVALVYQF